MRQISGGITGGYQCYPPVLPTPEMPCETESVNQAYLRLAPSESLQVLHPHPYEIAQPRDALLAIS